MKIRTLFDDLLERPEVATPLGCLGGILLALAVLAAYIAFLGGLAYVVVRVAKLAWGTQ